MFGPNDVKDLENVKEVSVDVIFTGKKKVSFFVMLEGETYVKKSSQVNNVAILHAR